ncbi:MAG: tetratricopeptide repeat protein [Rhodospirillaceae bacterium]|nr:tetratricopeptide repeat protein [Rhodospirillaceae bacterium]
MIHRLVLAAALLLGVAGSARADDAADLRAANEAFIAGDNVKALALIKPLAEKGNAEAQRNLGVMYLGGRGVNRDSAVAAEWFRKSADQGFASAAYQLGLLHYNGEGIAKDAVAAGVLFEKAAIGGVIEARHAVGRLAKERGDIAMAMASYEEAAVKGYMPAILDLAQMLEERGTATADKAAALADMTKAYVWVQVALAGVESGPARDEIHRFRTKLEQGLAARQPPAGERAMADAKSESEKLIAQIKAAVAERSRAVAPPPAAQTKPR